MMLEISQIQVRCLAGHRFMVAPNGPLRCLYCARDTYWTGCYSAPSLAEKGEDGNKTKYHKGIDPTEAYTLHL